jgi:acetyl esterase/lipase
VHGLSDSTVDYLQAVELTNALRAKGVPHELLLLEGVGHMFNFDLCQDQPMPKHLQPAVIAFLARHLLPNAPHARAEK